MVASPDLLPEVFGFDATVMDGADVLRVRAATLFSEVKPVEIKIMFGDELIAQYHAEAYPPDVLDPVRFDKPGSYALHESIITVERCADHLRGDSE